MWSWERWSRKRTQVRSCFYRRFSDILSADNMRFIFITFLWLNISKFFFGIWENITYLSEWMIFVFVTMIITLATSAFLFFVFRAFNTHKYSKVFIKFSKVNIFLFFLRDIFRNNYSNTLFLFEKFTKEPYTSAFLYFVFHLIQCIQYTKIVMSP